MIQNAVDILKNAPCFAPISRKRSVLEINKSKASELNRNNTY